MSNEKPSLRMRLLAQFNRVTISLQDLQEARAYLGAYGADGQSTTIQKALVTAAVVAYARPFKNSAPGKSSTPRVGERILRVLNPEQAALHERVLELRNRSVAHSDFEKKMTIRLTRSDGSGTDVLASIFDVRATLGDVGAFRALVEAVFASCVGETRRLNELLAPSDRALVDGVGEHPLHEKP